MKNVLALCLAVVLLVVPVYAAETDDLAPGVSDVEETPLVPGEDVPGGELDTTGGLTIVTDSVVLAEDIAPRAVLTSPVAGGPLIINVGLSVTSLALMSVVYGLVQLAVMPSREALYIKSVFRRFLTLNIGFMIAGILIPIFLLLV